MIHLMLGLVWLSFAGMLLIWRSMGRGPVDIDMWIAGALILAAYDLLRWGVTLLGRRRSVPPTEEPDERPPAPEVKNPEFDFSDRPDKNE